MFIKYNGTNVHAFPLVTMKTVRLKNKKTKKVRLVQKVDTNQSPQDVFWLRPGWNEFPKQVWEQNKENPGVKKMLKDGKIELMEAVVKTKVRTKAGKLKTVEKAIGQDDAEFRIKKLDEKMALAIIKDTFNREMLQRWLDEETRSRVKRALEKQINPLLPNAESQAS